MWYACVLLCQLRSTGSICSVLCERWKQKEPLVACASIWLADAIRIWVSFTSCSDSPCLCQLFWEHAKSLFSSTYSLEHCDVSFFWLPVLFVSWAGLRWLLYVPFGFLAAWASIKEYFCGNLPLCVVILNIIIYLNYCLRASMKWIWPSLHIALFKYLTGVSVSRLGTIIICILSRWAVMRQE